MQLRACSCVGRTRLRRWHSAAVAVSLGVTGCSGPATGPTPSASARPSAAPPRPEPTKPLADPAVTGVRFDPELELVTRSLRPTPTGNVESLRVDAKPAQSFVVDRAVVEVPTTVNPAALKALLDSVGLRQMPDTFRAKPSVGYLHSGARKAEPRARPAHATQYVLVQLDPARLASIDQKEAARLVRTLFKDGLDVHFGSKRGLQAFAYVLKHNATHPNVKLMLDFVAQPAQLLTSNSEGDGKPDLRTDDYFQITALGYAWQLALAAAPKAATATTAGVHVAVIDQGMLMHPIGMRWDTLVGWMSDFNLPGNAPHALWHGTDSASVLMAAVNDGQGAMGSALLAGGSKLPPNKLPRIQAIAGVLPAGVPTLAQLAAWIDVSVFDAHADVVSVSYRTWCDRDCREFGTSGSLERALHDANSVGSTIVFAGGNDGLEVPHDGRVDHLVGCQDGGGALCVGALNRLGERMSFSNFGSAVAVWAPGDFVDVNPLPIPLPPGIPESVTGPRTFSGTSAAAPFVAGVIALVETAWGEKFGTEAFRAMLKSATRTMSSGQFAVPVLDAERLLRQKLVLELDPSDVASRIAPNKPFMLTTNQPTTVMTLNAASDVDNFSFDLDGPCSDVQLNADYVPDPELGVLRLALTDPISAPKPLTQSEPRPGRLVALATNLGSGRHQVEVRQSGTLTTAYSLEIVPTPSQDQTCSGRVVRAVPERDPEAVNAPL